MQAILLSRRAALYSTTRLVEAANQRGHQVAVVDPLRCVVSVGGGRARVHCGEIDLSRADVVIPRIGSSMTEHGLAVLQQFELVGVPVVNSSLALGQARDKMRALQILAKHGIPVPRSVLIRDRRDVDDCLDRVGGLPVVLKLLRGTQGVGVMLADTRESLNSILDTMWSLEREVLIQQYIREARGRDLRVLVIAGEVTAAMRRSAIGAEFRANLHQGGVGREAKPTPQARRISLEAAAALGLAVAGVDLVETDRGPSIIEVNASPGFEGIERATGLDIAGRVIEYAATVAAPLRATG